MEHWFDRLTQPHTRRTTLRAAAIGGAALFLPLGRFSLARAFKAEPCYNFCTDEAHAQWTADVEACGAAFSPNKTPGYVRFVTGLAPGASTVFQSLQRARWIGCLAKADTTWHGTFLGCGSLPDCGDPTKYPGGNPPATLPGKANCDPTQEVPCGPGCCAAVGAQCCTCASSGEFKCCAVGKCDSCCRV